MTLIDSLYINMGGGKVLLDYLCRRLIERDVDFLLLKDERCGRLQCEDDIQHLVVMRAGLKERKAFYKQHRNDYTSVLCFGNVPPPVKMPCKVHTYFHNINLLTLKVHGWKRKIKCIIKREIIRCNKKNTQYWIVQTINTATCLSKVLNIDSNSIIILPFYNIIQYDDISAPHYAHEYVFIGEYTNEKGHLPLVKAWSILHRMGYKLKLHLTFSGGPNYFISQYNKFINEGILIENHGFVPHKEVFKLLRRCKATIYPSYNESFGLGLIEAIEAGCDVLASDLPFTYSVCVPSEVFNPHDPKSIAEAVLRYENGTSKRTRLLVRDSIDELIDTITSCKD